VHQGRGAESIFFGSIVEPGEIVPSNAHFDTTRAHIEVRDGVALDLPVPEALDPLAEAPFKGTWTSASSRSPASSSRPRMQRRR
jgi:tryptophanase